MAEFVCLMIGASAGVFVTALLQANRNVEDQERAKHAIKMAKYYKEKCYELNDIINKNVNGEFENEIQEKQQ